jgi:hypothetical protein
VSPYLAAQPAPRIPRDQLELPLVEDGTIGHAAFRISIPENWNGGLVDPLVPIWVTQRYETLTQIANTHHLYVQMWVDQSGAAYEPALMERAFELLETWILDGERPQPGELTKE